MPKIEKLKFGSINSKLQFNFKSSNLIILNRKLEVKHPKVQIRTTTFNSSNYKIYLRKVNCKSSNTEVKIKKFQFESLNSIAHNQSQKLKCKLKHFDAISQI